jgi:hypothetical protein
MIQGNLRRRSLTFGTEYAKIALLALLWGVPIACGPVMCFHFSLYSSSLHKVKICTQAR